MAKTKNSKNLRNETPVTIPRSYDIFSIENRVHDLETNGGGGGSTSWNFSTDEVATGQKWIDGKDIYCKVYVPASTQALVSNRWTNLGVSLTIDTLIDCQINFTDVTEGHFGGNDGIFLTQKTATGIDYYSQTAVGNIAFAIIYYTK